MNEYLNALDAFAMPSFYEGIPVSAIEAQANGLKCYLSENINHDVELAEDVSFLPIDEPKKWADIIMSEKNFCHKNNDEKIISGGYDISKTAEFIMQLYKGE